MVTAPCSWAAVVTLPAGAVPGVIGPRVPAQTMLLLSDAQAPRTPQPAVPGSAYRLFAAQPSWRAPDSPPRSVLLSPSVIWAMRVCRFAVRQPFTNSAPG